MFGGGSGAGITIVPVAFLAVCQGNVKLLRSRRPEQLWTELLSLSRDNRQDKQL